MSKKASFIRVKCEKCKNEQIIFSRATMPIKCLVCGEELAKPTGGIVSIKCKVLQEL